ncbi:hypothetical protein [Mucilaginibacter sp.]|uniref:hypothetical protein n=1 Tax=Mucilaginibacter sp. TaxID=1882438 RepID=UPI0025CD9077|nr:hypothetical protein [Mucilaginibacter sp.]
MVKIIVHQDRQKEYWLNIGQALKDEINSYLKAFDHLKGLNIVDDDTDFTVYKGAVVDLVNLAAKTPKKTTDFNQPIYKKALDEYLKGKEQVAHNVLDNMATFLNVLLDKNGAELKNLLLCPPDGLLDKHNELNSSYTINTGLEKKIIGLIFNFKTCDRIVKPIKNFFRIPELVLTCPYCNLHKVNYVEGEEGGTGEVHELDHFFDKTVHPLLSYSLFNLVPSDTFCNKSYNKGQEKVTKTYHINPYEKGYVAALRFKPILAGDAIDQFELDVQIPRTDPLFDQMFGSLGVIKDDTRSGNLNMFKIRARYNDKLVKKDAAKYLKKIKNYAASRRRMVGFFKRMGKDISLNAHNAWYEDLLPTHFEQKYFHDAPCSKLYRDLHDYVFTNDKHWFNKDVRKLIDDQPLEN